MAGNVDANGSPLLSVIVPVFNEARTIDAILTRLQAVNHFMKEVIVVDDGSDDETSSLLKAWESVPGFSVFHHPKNLGKGAAIRTGLAHAKGDITIIQDADLEYDPRDIPLLVSPIRDGAARVVYGSRYLAPPRSLPWSKFRLGVHFINCLVRVLFGQKLTDEATCYKVMPTRLLLDLDVRSQRFDFCAEVTAKLCRLGIAIREVPISYSPRGKQAGKKIGWLDAWSTVWTLLKWRAFPVGRKP